MFEIKDVDLAGRIGVIHTKSGRIETPAFFPVIDPLRQEVTPQEVYEIGFKQVITNAYLTMKRYGREAVEKGIHRLLGFNGVVMTDSGAYQILEYGGIEASQEEVIRFQEAIGSDIGVILDIPTGDVDREKAEESVEETLKRAREALKYIRDSETLWLLPVQGGSHLDLVEYSASRAASLGEYSIYGVGSPTVYLERYMYDTVTDIIYTAKKRLPGGKPVHLFGAGHPLIIPYAVALGVDTFDSASYILYARDGRYITDYGVERLENLDYLPCTCPICSRYTVEELKEMDEKERTRLLAIHNLYKIKETIERVKLYIREGRLWELLEEYSRKHHKTYDVMKRFPRYRDLLEESSPKSAKGVVRGIRLYDRQSMYNPRILHYRERVLSLASRLYTLKSYTLLLAPYTGECRQPEAGVEILYYKPFLGAIPWQLCGVYPTIQSHHPDTLDDYIVEDLAYMLASILDKAGPSKPARRVLLVDRGLDWSVKLEEVLARIGVRFDEVLYRG